MKKIIALLIVTAMMLTFTACGGEDTPPATDPTPTAAQQQENKDDRQLNREDEPLNREDDRNSGQIGTVDNLLANITSPDDVMDIIWGEQDAATKQQIADEVAKDGGKVEFGADGSMTITYDNGEITKQNPDGSWTVIDEDGERATMGGKWKDNEFTKGIADPGFEILVTDEKENGYVVGFEGATVDRIKAFAQQVKAAGYNIDPQEEDMEMGDMVIYSYTAHNRAGCTAVVSYAMGVASVTFEK